MPSKSSVIAMLGALKEGDLAAVQALVAADATLLCCDLNGMGTQPIHIACDRGHLTIVQWLKEQGVALDTRDNNGSQPIHWACGRITIVQWLKEQGVALDACSNNGTTPLQLACRSITWATQHEGDKRQRHQQVVDFLETSLLGTTSSPMPSTSSSQQSFINAMLAALKEGDLAAVQAHVAADATLLCCDLGEGMQPIHYACEYGHLHIVQWLKEQGVALDTRSHCGTPLQLARNERHRQVVDYLEALANDTDKDYLEEEERAAEESREEEAQVRRRDQSKLAAERSTEEEKMPPQEQVEATPAPSPPQAYFVAR